MHLASNKLNILGVVLAFANVCFGAYLITTPRRWLGGENNQICVTVLDRSAPEGSLTVNLVSRDFGGFGREERNITVIPHTTFGVPAGQTEFCQDVRLPNSEYFNGDLTLAGCLGGTCINETRNLVLNNRLNLTFIQTDKYLYKPGQQVQFRVLTIYGSAAKVATDPYPEIWVETPSDIRVAQWINVDNSAGLIHLSFQLADEPELGIYNIYLRNSENSRSVRQFKVEEFVLPRFEVTVEPPKFILATDDSFSFKVCAEYTFGQPVKGTLKFELSNNQRRRCRVVSEKVERIDGCVDITVRAKEMRITECQVFSLSATAIVEENGTGVKLNGTARANIERRAIRFETVYEDNYKKPNLPFRIKVRAVRPDDTPAVGTPIEVCASGMCVNQTVPEDGILSATVASDDVTRIFMTALNCRADLHQSTYSKNVDLYFSPSNSSLQIQAPEGKLKCTPGKANEYVLPVLFSANNQPSALVTTQIISRGKILSSSTRSVALPPASFPVDLSSLVDTPTYPAPPIIMGVFYLPVVLPPTASPKVQILIWYVREDGEVVSDSTEVEVEKCLAFDTSLTWSSAQGQPGERTQLTLEAEPNAICSIGVVDKSTELLNPDPNPISLQAIFNHLESHDVFPFFNSQVDEFEYCRRKVFGDTPPPSPFGGFGGFPHYYTEYVDALQMFDLAGVFAISDFILETRPCEKDEDVGFPGPPPGAFASVGGFGGGRPEIADGVAFAGRLPAGTPAQGDDAVSPRTDFPETWLWQLVVLPPSGKLEDTVVLPDTITEWGGTAVCAHPEKGVGVSERAPITTFTPFFADLTLPPTVKRGEILPVKISVFNYLNERLPVTVNLALSPEYEILDDLAQGGNGRMACVPPQDTVVHTIRIRPQALGNVNLTVSTFVDSRLNSECPSQVARRDVLIKPIKVEVEGFLRESTWTKYVCAEELASGEDSLETLQVVPPAGIVPDSARGWVTAVGDLLALSLENLGSLIRQPYGCGEQNMINFAPNIYILEYLMATNQATPESTEKLLRFMRTGYQRELLYRRRDGSYSAFGNADDSGSTWLTAFVLKSFTLAQRFISVDSQGLSQTRDWLANSTVNQNGCIVPVGKIFSKGLTGGLAGRGSPVPMTAYIIISLLEAGIPVNVPILQQAGRCIIGDSTRDPYTLAMKAYALSLAKDPNAQTVIQQLLSLAVNEQNAIYWDLPQGRHRSNALAVETAGYAILALLTQNPDANILDARKIVKWITTQRNGQGGFFSTQDTVVALQALAKYETHSFQGPLNVVANVEARDLNHAFSVTDENKLLQQLVKLPVIPTSVNITMEGQGCAVLQAVLRYNIPEPEGSDAFNLRVTPANDPDGGCIIKRIEACTSYLLPDGQSNMAVIEVNLVSGFIPLKEDLRAAVARNPDVVKRFEVDGGKVSFYVEEITAVPVCVAFRITQEVKIEDVKPGTVVVYDYYQPEFSVSQSYVFPFLDGCGK